MKDDKADSFKSSSSVNVVEMVKQNPQIINSLRQLGLNQYQAKVYLALSALGKSTAGEISDKSEVPRARAYDVLEELSQKGFVAVKSGRPVQYSSLPIDEAVSTLKKHRQTFLVEELKKMEDLGSKLQGLMKNASVKQGFPVDENVWTLKGRDAIYSKMATMLEKSKKHVTISTSADGVCRKLLAHRNQLKDAFSRGVKVNVVSQIPKDHEAWTACGDVLKMTQIHDKSIPTRMLLADDQALLFLTHDKTEPEEEVGLWVKSPHMISTLKEALPVQARK
ncbi:MAG: TrmB family transcriptional regulator [Candidatus Micrarchaeia archaeon]